MKIRSSKYNISAGLTMIELLVVLSVFSILSFMAAPRVSELLESFNKRDAEMLILQDLRVAQAMAVEQGCIGILQIANAGKEYTFGCDYVPFDTNSPPTWDVAKFTRRLPANVRVTSSGLIIFNTRGQAIDETGALNNYTITLSVEKYGSLQVFNTGTLRATGFFSYQS